MATSEPRGRPLKSPSRPFLFLTLIPGVGGTRAARRRGPHAMAYVAAPDRTSARKIARTIVERRLAACANLWPVESMYRWRGPRGEAREVVIVSKAREARFGPRCAAGPGTAGCG